RGQAILHDNELRKVRLALTTRGDTDVGPKAVIDQTARLAAEAGIAGPRQACIYSSLLHKDCTSSSGEERGAANVGFRLLSGATVPHAKPVGAWVEIVFVGIRLCDRLIHAARCPHRRADSEVRGILLDAYIAAFDMYAFGARVKGHLYHA